MKELFSQVKENVDHFHWSLELLFEGFQTFRRDAMLYFSFSKLYEEAEIGLGNTREIQDLKVQNFCLMYLE